MTGGNIAKRTLAWLAAVLALAGVLRFAHLRNHLASPLGAVEEEIVYTDFAAFAAWAKRIAGGDVLSRDTYHPYMDWMEPIAPLAEFERWWGGKEILHQAPLYPYLLAASYALTGGPRLMLHLQAALGTFSVFLVFAIGRRLWDDRAGLVAAILAALFPPAIVLDAIPLRDTMVAYLALLAVWALLRLKEAPGPGRALAAGLILGLGLLLKPTGILLAAGAALVLLALPASRLAWRRWLPALTGGLLLCLLPLAARNLAVGAPLLALSTRGPETVLQGNNLHADPGLFTTPPRERYAALMERAHPSVRAALAAARDTWPEGGRTGWLLWHWGRKLIAAYRNFEYPNNTNFYFYRDSTPVLAYLPGFGWFAGAALVGAFLLAWRGRDRGGALFVLAAALALLAGILAAFAHYRYRLSLGLLLTVPAGATAAFAAGRLRAGRPLPALAALVSAALLSVPSFVWAPPRFLLDREERMIQMTNAASLAYEEESALRPMEYVRAAAILARRGDPAGAEALLEDYVGKLAAFFGAYRPGVGEAGRFFLRQAGWRSYQEAARAFAGLERPERAAALRREAERLLRG